MQKLAHWIIRITVFLVPLFFLPITRDAFDYNKFALLLTTSLILLGLWATNTIKKGRIEVAFSNLDRAVFIVLGTYLLSYIVASPNKIMALTQQGATGSMFVLVLFYFLVRQFLQGEKQDKIYSVVILPLLFSATALSVVMILQAAGIIGRFPVPAYMQTRTFTPAGSLVSLASFLILALVVALQKTVKVFKKGSSTEKTLMSTIVPILVIAVAGIGMLVARPENKPIFLPQGAGWTVAISSFSKPLSAVVGVGSGNFVNAYTTGKPSYLNQTDFWRLRSGASSNWYFQTMTETGILGILAVGFLIYTVVKNPKRSPAVMAAFVLALLIPGNFLLLFVLFAMLAILDIDRMIMYGFPAKRGEKDLIGSAYEELVEKNVTNNNLTRPLVTVIAVVIILVVGAAFYFGGRAYAADVTMRSGIQSAFTPNNQQTYELQRTAIMLNPFEADYRVIFAQTNMALANLISQQPELTDEQKQTVTQLVVQSVNNGKLAVRLFPSAVTWENLGLLYTNLLNAVQGADTWTIALYQEALKLDPNNPGLHIALGGIHYSLQRYDAALQEFGIAIQLKGDYANAWYNAANAFREIKNVEAARAAYQNTLSLVEQGTPDYDKAKSEMDALPAMAPATSNEGLQELTPPESTPSAAIEDAPVDEVAPEVQVNEEEAVNATESGNLLLDQQPTPTP